MGILEAVAQSCTAVQNKKTQPWSVTHGSHQQQLERPCCLLWFGTLRSKERHCCTWGQCWQQSNMGLCMAFQTNQQESKRNYGMRSWCYSGSRSSQRLEWCYPRLSSNYTKSQRLRLVQGWYRRIQTSLSQCESRHYLNSAWSLGSGSRESRLEIMQSADRMWFELESTSFQ